MESGRNLKDNVINEVSKKLKKRLQKSGVVILHKFPFKFLFKFANENLYLFLEEMPSFYSQECTSNLMKYSKSYMSLFCFLGWKYD